MAALLPKSICRFPPTVKIAYEWVIEMLPLLVSRYSRVLTTVFALGVLAACNSHAPPKVDEERVKQLVGRGYASDDHFKVSTNNFSWVVGEFTFDLSLAAPVTAVNTPLVIYLPGLGESRSAGESWRTGWAQAGYSVLVVQPLLDDQQAWSSAPARRGDFDALGRERYASQVVTVRLKALAGIMAEILKRRGKGDATLQNIDISHIAVAGYDVGAYSAMLVVGEIPKAGFAPVTLPLTISAIVALSPYADFSGNTFSTRYQAITAPVLSVSGDGDSDAFGAVVSPQIRKAPYQNMPSKESYLLWLNNLGHSTMSGGKVAMGEEPDKLDNKLDGDESKPHQHGSGSRHGSRQGGKDSHGASERGSGEDGSQRGGRGMMGLSPTDRAIAIKLILGVTTAFLDAYVKKDPIAAEWLQKDAQHWVGERGTLLHK